jgi:hypothetical protein
MANITLTVGAWVATVEAANDERVIDILTAYEAAYKLPATGTPQVRLQRMLEHLVGHVETVAQDYLKRTAVEQRAHEVDAMPIRFG